MREKWTFYWCFCVFLLVLEGLVASKDVANQIPDTKINLEAFQTHSIGSKKASLQTEQSNQPTTKTTLCFDGLPGFGFRAID